MYVNFIDEHERLSRKNERITIQTSYFQELKFQQVK